jgi:AcrR family transcriptional regulator
MRARVIAMACASPERVSPRAAQARSGAPARRSGGERFAGLQRTRLLAGARAAVGELGYGRATVGEITARARVSRRTFYELFDDREACLAALIADIFERLEGEIASAGLAGLPWRERLRGGLLAVLSFFDREPLLARIAVVEALRGEPRVLALREEAMTRLAAIVDGGRDESARGGGCSTLTAEGVVGAVFTAVYRRLLRGEREPLANLTGELMGMIVLPYLGGAAARRERLRAVSAAAPVSPTLPPADGELLAEVPMRITYRTVRVLECVGRSPGISNRAVGERAGIADAGQVSKLMTRLERLRLVGNSGGGHSKGEPNAWELTELGAQITRRLATADQPSPATAATVGRTPQRLAS